MTVTANRTFLVPMYAPLMDLHSAHAYFLTFHTYGTWLHGSDKGSVDLAHNAFGSPRLMPNPARELTNSARLKSDPFKLNKRQRDIVDATIREVAAHRRWRLLALNVRTNHVHVVVSGQDTPERMLGDFKRWATRRLRDSGEISSEQRIWTVHGSTRHLFDDESVYEACNYTINRQ